MLKTLYIFCCYYYLFPTWLRKFYKFEYHMMNIVNLVVFEIILVNIYKYKIKHLKKVPAYIHISQFNIKFKRNKGKVRSERKKKKLNLSL